MIIYFSLSEYAQDKKINRATADHRRKNGRLMKVCDLNGKKVGYVDVVDALVLTSEGIRTLIS